MALESEHTCSYLREESGGDKEQQVRFAQPKTRRELCPKIYIYMHMAISDIAASATTDERCQCFHIPDSLPPSTISTTGTIRTMTATMIERQCQDLQVLYETQWLHKHDSSSTFRCQNRKERGVWRISHLLTLKRGKRRGFPTFWCLKGMAEGR